MFPAAHAIDRLNATIPVVAVVVVVVSVGTAP